MVGFARIVLCITLQTIFADAARILAVYPVPSISHQITFRPITLELIKRGHEVVVMTPDPMFKKGETPANLTEIDVHDLSYRTWQVFMESAKGKKEDLITQMRVASEMLIDLVDLQLQNKEVKEIIKGKQHFDLLLVEACVRPALAFSQVYKVPLIQISSFGAIFENYAVIGAPTHPFLYPSSMNQRIYNLTIYEKLYELYNNYMIDRLFNGMADDEHKMLKKHFGPDIPHITELQNRIDMLFLNVNPIWEGIRPVPPSVIHLGGLPQKPHKELPQDLKTYLDSSKNGVIYISFGTNVKPSLLPAEKIQTLIKAFSKMPYDVLWKWDKDELPGKSANIRISKWLPQSDLLKHPKIKLFVTQGGLQSTDEAITAGVPLVGVPMLGDQWYNVEKYVHHGIGVKLELISLTEETFSTAVNTVIGDESYRKNINKLRTLMTDQPMKPLDRGIWWIEHVLRHGGAKHLRSPVANISWAEYMEFELIAIVLSALLAVLAIAIGLVYSLYSFVTKNYVIKTKVKSS
ncbi:UDP-glycosyltransferase UGT5 isoform X3 [Spodoptera frugiperda]|uniref:UDP-glucuronosyltransferase n=1 Tax=Spodoptera frugiperda TaxID=7108 RepID=A0A9R0ER95_SPOFR|nr:UDP-glycosyltransferase UGT5 isoform X3 [Spodoptera frugiperda]